MTELIRSDLLNEFENHLKTLSPNVEDVMNFEPRFKFDQRDQLMLDACLIASGSWDRTVVGEREALAALTEFFGGLPCTPESLTKSTDSIFKGCRLQLMARRAANFPDIQMSPVFSKNAKARFYALYEAWITGGEAQFEKKWDGFSLDKPMSANAEVTRFLGGDGLSKEQAVQIDAPDHETAIDAEYWWLAYRMGKMNSEWTRTRQLLTRPDSAGRCFDVLSIKHRDGKEAEYWFDMTRWTR